MKLFPFLALLPIAFATPVCANTTRSMPVAPASVTIETQSGKTYTVKSQHASCRVTGDTKDTYKMLKCSSYGVLEDLVGNHEQYNDEDSYCAHISGRLPDIYEYILDKEKDNLACGIAREFKIFQ